MTKIGSGAWVVVCDGRKALILENKGDEKFPNLQTLETYEQENPKTSDQGTDRPGRVHDATSPGRSSVEQTDWHDKAEEEFVQSLARRLDKAVTGGETSSLILVAAPRALGMLRDAMTDAVRAATAEEIDKDYVKLPVYEIEKHLLKAD